LDCVGGNAVNVAAKIAARGFPSAYAGVVGDDEQGTRILRSLQNVGVNIDCVVRAHGPTGLTEIQVRGGDYAIVLESYGVSDQLEITEALRRYLSAHATRIHLTVTGRAGALILDLRQFSLPISIDLGIVRSAKDLDRFDNLLPLVSEAFFSAGSSAEDPVVAAALGKAALLGARTAIATRGERGCAALLDGERFAVWSRITAGEIVDPLGAGDAFIAGYLSTLNGDSPNGPGTAEHRLLTASTWAAQACKQIGGWPGAEQ
jgi:sugar/nucleoside kinase (ribokinase family)